MMLTRRRQGPRQVIFDPPRPANFLALDRSIGGECVVLEVNDHGARIEPLGPSLPQEFFLMFTTRPNPVFRRCRTVWSHQGQIGAAYIWPKPEDAVTEARPPEGCEHELR